MYFLLLSILNHAINLVLTKLTRDVTGRISNVALFRADVDALLARPLRPRVHHNIVPRAFPLKVAGAGKALGTRLVHRHSLTSALSSFSAKYR